MWCLSQSIKTRGMGCLFDMNLNHWLKWLFSFSTVQFYFCYKHVICEEITMILLQRCLLTGDLDNSIKVLEIIKAEVKE